MTEKKGRNVGRVALIHMRLTAEDLDYFVRQVDRSLAELDA